jgi:hypothetical protein
MIHSYGGVEGIELNNVLKVLRKVDIPESSLVEEDV